jgi:hypothetical protein
MGLLAVSPVGGYSDAVETATEPGQQESPPTARDRIPSHTVPETALVPIRTLVALVTPAHIRRGQPVRLPACRAGVNPWIPPCRPPQGRARPCELRTILIVHCQTPFDCPHTRGVNRILPAADGRCRPLYVGRTTEQKSREFSTADRTENPGQSTSKIPEFHNRGAYSPRVVSGVVRTLYAGLTAEQFPEKFRL